MRLTRAEIRERNREKWRKLPCPRCHAKAGERCKGPSGYRVTVHRERRFQKAPPPIATLPNQYVARAPLDHGEYFDRFVKEAAQSEAVRYEEEVYWIVERCESPIEALLIAALHKHSKLGCEAFDFCCATDKPPSAAPPFDETAFVYTQVCLGNYRVDILILDASMPFDLREPSWIIVECDGHDYHERTKEQARRDKQRDRFFTAKGFRVLRFTGSEIWADPDACAAEIVENLSCNEYRRFEAK